MVPLRKALKSVLELAAKALQIRKKVHEQGKFRNNPKQVSKLWHDIKAIGKDFKGKEPLFCIDETTIDVAEHVKAQTKWSGKNVTFSPNNPKRFKIIEKAEKAKFDPIEKYRWANKKAQQGGYAIFYNLFYYFYYVVL